MKKSLLLIAAIATVIMFASCGGDDPKNKDPENGGKVEAKGGTITYDGGTYEITNACQDNQGKTYQGQEIPRNYIELCLYKERLIENEGSKYYDTLHYVKVGAFCNEELLSAGTYTLETTAGHQTFLSTHALVWYEFNNVGEVFQKSNKFDGTVTIAKSGDNYTIDIDWVDQDSKKPFKVHYVGAVPSGKFTFIR